MNPYDGRIYHFAENEATKEGLVEMMIPPTEKQLARKPFPKVERNEPCPCGSGKKFKKCCLRAAESGKEKEG